MATSFQQIEDELKKIALTNKQIDSNVSSVEADIEPDSLNNISQKLKEFSKQQGEKQGSGFGLRNEIGQLGSRPEFTKALLEKKFGEGNVIEAGGTLFFREGQGASFKPVNKKGLDSGDVAEFLPSLSRFGTTLGTEITGGLLGSPLGPGGVVAGGITGAAAGEALNESNILAKARKEGLLTPEEESEALSRITGAGAGGAAGAAIGGVAGSVLKRLGGPIVAKLSKTPAGKQVLKSLNEAKEKTFGGLLERFGAGGSSLTKQKGQVGEAIITKELSEEAGTTSIDNFGGIMSKNIGQFVKNINQQSSILLNEVRDSVVNQAKGGKATYADASDLMKGLDNELQVLESQGAFNFGNLSAQEVRNSLQTSLNGVNKTFFSAVEFDPTKVTSADLLNTRVGLQNQIKKFKNPNSDLYNPQVSNLLIGVKKAIDESIDSSMKTLANSVDDEIVDESLESISKIGNIKIPKNSPEFAKIRQGLKMRADGFKVVDSKTRELVYKNKSGELLSPEKVAQNFDGINFNKARASQVRNVILKQSPDDFKELSKAFRQKQLLKAERGEKGMIRSPISDKAKRTAGFLEDAEFSNAQKAGIDPSEGIDEIKKLASESDKSIRRDPSFRAGSVVDQTNRIAPKVKSLLGEDGFDEAMKPVKDLADFQAAQDKNLTTRGLFDVVEKSAGSIPLIGPLVSGVLSGTEGVARQGARAVAPLTKVPLAPTKNLLQGLLGQSQAGSKEEEEEINKRKFR